MTKKWGESRLSVLFVKQFFWIMRRLLFFLLLLFVACDHSPEGPKKVGLCVVATGRYIEFVKPLIESGRKNFCPDHVVTYFVFTDGEVEKAPDVVRIHQDRLGWPHDTLKRFHMYAAQREMLEKLDYVYAIDADAHFAEPIGEEIFSRRVFTQHPGFLGKTGTYERKKTSTAYVKKKLGKTYCCGGFYGGTSREFLKFVQRASEMVDTDISVGYVAKWHDESYLNRYVVDYPPTKTLSPSFCYPEGWELPFEKKIVVLLKDHEEVRR